MYNNKIPPINLRPVTVSYTHLRAHETGRKLVCRLLLEKKKNRAFATIAKFSNMMVKGIYCARDP